MNRFPHHRAAPGLQRPPYWAFRAPPSQIEFVVVGMYKAIKCMGCVDQNQRGRIEAEAESSGSGIYMYSMNLGGVLETRSFDCSSRLRALAPPHVKAWLCRGHSTPHLLWHLFFYNFRFCHSNPNLMSVYALHCLEVDNYSTPSKLP
jgi:hypothetical protein